MLTNIYVHRSDTGERLNVPIDTIFASSPCGNGWIRLQTEFVMIRESLQKCCAIFNQNARLFD